MNHLEHIIESFKINYKMWIVFILSCILLSPNFNIFKGIIIYMVCMLQAYWAHRVAHHYLFFFFNRAHIYHHENTDPMSHIVQVCIEISAVYLPFFMMYLLDFKDDIFPLDPYIFIMFSFFYTSVHNINYGQLHVNEVHYKHHLNYEVNYGPDICDIIFKTKYPIDSIENTDHYIPNIIVSTIIALLCKFIYTTSNYKQQIRHFIFKIYVIISSFVAYYTYKQSIIDINKYFTKQRNDVDNKVKSILLRLI